MKTTLTWYDLTVQLQNNRQHPELPLLSLSLSLSLSLILIITAGLCGRLWAVIKIVPERNSRPHQKCNPLSGSNHIKSVSLRDGPQSGSWCRPTSVGSYTLRSLTHTGSAATNNLLGAATCFKSVWQTPRDAKSCMEREDEWRGFLYSMRWCYAKGQGDL